MLRVVVLTYALATVVRRGTPSLQRKVRKGATLRVKLSVSQEVAYARSRHARELVNVTGLQAVARRGISLGKRIARLAVVSSSLVQGEAARLSTFGDPGSPSVVEKDGLVYSVAGAAAPASSTLGATLLDACRVLRAFVRFNELLVLAMASPLTSP